MTSDTSKIYYCDVCGKKEHSGWYKPPGWQYTTNWGDICDAHRVTLTPAPPKRTDWFSIMIGVFGFLCGTILSFILLGLLW